MTAAAAASSLFTPFVPISKRASPRGFISFPSLYNPLSLPSPISPSSPRLPFSRKTRRVRARILQEKDEKVRVEDSFRVGTSPVDGGKIADDVPPTTTPGTVERWVIKFEQSLNVLLVESVIVILDALYKDRNYPRFYVLETIARVPYFAFISVLHLYESIGWWRKSEYIKVHFAESWNELHHLLIMEELGGNAFWFDRFLAQHIAVFYYFMTVAMYILSPRMAYHFSECVEEHAFSTYDKFLKLKGEELKKQPAPEIAIKYYMSEDMYMFDEFQTDRAPRTRRPNIENLYDVFVNIRDDEAEHCKTMKACQIPGNLRSPHSVDLSSQEGDEVPAAACEGVVDSVKMSSTPST